MLLIDLLNKSQNKYPNDYKKAAEYINEVIKTLPDNVFIETIRMIGIIPEVIAHDSSEEKLYSKASDIILSECFNKLGLSSKVLSERGDSADIIAQSKSGYNYSLVADAKCFRLSRTAKNQKDFKISNLSSWRGEENEYAVLVAPYYQYPQVRSQVYSKALEYNVCLLSWEHISILLEYGVKESENFTLESLWNASSMIARNTSISSSSECTFLPKMNAYISKKAGIKKEDFEKKMQDCRKVITKQCKEEIAFWNNEILKIQKYSREEAVCELIEAKKIYQKIDTLNKYINRLQRGEIV